MNSRNGPMICAAVALFAVRVASADPFTYQGQVKNNGLAATANYDFQFTLYDIQSPGGAVIAGPVAVNNVAASVGLFTVQLDFGIPPFTGADRYLEITVRPTGGGAFTTLSPRQLLTATPYALFSKTGSATQLQTRDVNAVAPAAGQVLKWTGADWSPGADNNSAYVAGAGLTLAGNSFSISNNGVTNGMLASDALSLNKVSGGTMFANSAPAFVGVGRSAPATSNEYFGIQAPVTTAGTFGGMYVQTQGATARPFYGYSAGNGATTAFHYLDGNDSNKWKLNNSQDWLTLSRTGLFAVGNGVADKFRVDGPTGDVTFTDPNASITFPATAGANSPMIQMFATGAANADRMVIAHSAAFPTYGLQYQDSSEKFNFLGAGLPVLSIDLQGSKVGIGTSSPGYKLDVADRMRIRQGSSGSAGLNFYQTTPAADRAFVGMFNDTTVGIYGYTGTGWNFLMDTTNGNIGIGTIDLTTGAKLAVNGKVLCTELEVQLAADWPDYVFDSSYNLPPLGELEQQIQRDKHLPGVPSAQEVQCEGVKVGQMQTKLLEKVEELTLYVIKLDKQLDQVNQENSQLRERVARLEAGGR